MNDGWITCEICGGRWHPITLNGVTIADRRGEPERCPSELTSRTFVSPEQFGATKVFDELTPHDREQVMAHLVARVTTEGSER